MIRSFLVAATLIALLLPGPALADGLLIIANASVRTAAPLTLKQIAAIYLLRTTVWPDGSHIVPVNREATSAIRADFTARVLKQDNESLAAYWNQMHFMGREPPVVQESDDAMLAFVRKVPGAVGYVDAATRPADVMVLAHVR